MGAGGLMPMREATFYQVACDYPGCEEVAENYDYSWHGDEGAAVDAADDWLILNFWTENGVPPEGPATFWCPKHWYSDDDNFGHPKEAPSDAYDWAIAIDRGPQDTYVYQSESEAHARVAQSLSDGWSLYRRVKRDRPPAVSERAVDHGWEKVE